MTTENTICNCYTENLERVKNHLTESGAIPEGAIEVDVSWENQTYILSGGDHSPVNPKINFKYRAAKKNGGHAINKREEKINIFANFCCFCGRKYQKNGKA